MFNILNSLELAAESRLTIGVGRRELGLVGTGLKYYYYFLARNIAQVGDMALNLQHSLTKYYFFSSYDLKKTAIPVQGSVPPGFGLY